MTKGIDPEVLRAIVGDDPEMVREVIEDFVPAARSGIAEIRAAADGATAERVKLASHKLKGSSLLVGARGLGDLCARLEVAGQARDWAMIALLLPQLDGQMGDIEAAAAAFLGEPRA
jgi:HPt (histidine-containing phosphotransfer) domain-containing protein